MAVVVPAQASNAPASRGSTPASQGFTPRAADGASPAAQALAPKKPSGFLQLFRKIAGAGRKAPADAGRTGAAVETPSGQEAARRKPRASEAGEFRAQAGAARAGGRPRRGSVARQGGRQARPDAWLEAAALPAPAPARRLHGSADIAPPTVEAQGAPRPAQARVFVVDLRTRSAAGGQQPGIHRETAAPERVEAPRSFERVMLAREAGNAAPAAATPPASPTSRSGNAPASVSGPALRERLLPEIVRQAGIVLRDGGEGEIRLVLKPEHLGSVRIRLQLGESSLEGRIVVDNSNVKELLDAHLEQLKSALRQEGYASANIDVTVSGGGGGRRDLPPDPALPAVAGRTAGEFERATPAILDLGFTTVNLLI